MTNALTKIADDMAALLPLFEDGGTIAGLILPTQHEATFKALAIEAKSILGERLGHANDFSMGLIHAVNSGSGGIIKGPSYASVQEASQIVHAAVREINRRQVQPSASSGASKSYVAPSRICELEGLPKGQWDFARLIQLCLEINIAAHNDCHISTAALLRTVLNHVPPVFGYKSFAEVANNYGGGKSFSASMKRLEDGSRTIADGHLHTTIRQTESLPSKVQVDFAAELDVLLGEVVRLTKSAAQRPLPNDLG